MRFLAAVVAITLVIGFQVAVLPSVTLFGVRPNLLLVLGLIWAMVRGPDEGRVVVFSAAVVYGLLLPEPAGFPVMAMAPIIPLVMLRDTGVISSRFLMTLVLVAIATLCHEMIYTLLLTLTEKGVNPLVTAIRVYLPSMLVNVALVPFIYFILNRASWDLRARRY